MFDVQWICDSLGRDGQGLVHASYCRRGRGINVDDVSSCSFSFCFRSSNRTLHLVSLSLSFVICMFSVKIIVLEHKHLFYFLIRVESEILNFWCYCKCPWLALFLFCIIFRCFYVPIFSQMTSSTLSLGLGEEEQKFGLMTLFLQKSFSCAARGFLPLLSS